MGNQMSQALIAAGLAEEPKQKSKFHRKTFHCNKCKAKMIQPEGTNVIVCPQCASSYFIFDKH